MTIATTFRQLLDEFDQSAKTTTAKGRRFEEFCAKFMRTDPLLANRYDKVWLWQEWEGRDGAVDTGVDIVAREAGGGDLVAIQCKFYSPTTQVTLQHVSNFLAVLGRPEFARGLFISTSDRVSKRVDEAMEKFAKPIQRLGIDYFEEANIDWTGYRIGQTGEFNLIPPKDLYEHQKQAIDDVVSGLELIDRGQLIMACGTGKTFTSLRLAERMVGVGGTVLFLVPSINLLSQSVKAWANDAEIPLVTFAVCSDSRAGARRSDEDSSPNDLAFPASTDSDRLAIELAARVRADAMTVVFSTYQSIDIIGECQGNVLGKFDLIVADEAHRTTGVTLADSDDSAFTRVHDNTRIDAAKRIYMTATPRIYGDPTKQKARDKDAKLASMDDESKFGPELHRLPFGEAVENGLLTDYKVIVLAVDEGEVSRHFQEQLAKDGAELSLDDASRFIGCWHALSKRGPEFEGDRSPMQRAVSFTSTIAQSKTVAKLLPEIVGTVLENREDRNAVRIEARHVDGTTNVQVRSEAVAWLEEPPGQGVCRLLTNAKCLTEGVDVPALDAVLFLKPRKSIVDVVQAVGRVMRLAPGKSYGYVILPVVVPAGVTAEQALSDNKRYEVVWEVLRALRSHDERLNAEINKINLNGKSDMIKASMVGLGVGNDEGDPLRTTSNEIREDQMTLNLAGRWTNALYAKIVEKVGDRHYWEEWAKDIQRIAESHETRIRGILDRQVADDPAVAAFDVFLLALKANLNESVDRDAAINMLSQHLITRPVFEAVFGKDQFTRSNTVSQNMEKVVEQLDQRRVDRETDQTLSKFYKSVQMRAEGIETASGKQQIIAELYEQFFKKAMPKLASSLGIVYTPVEVVDFINRSVEELLNRHFDGASIADEGVHILDPFSGTGTFLTRLIQAGNIPKEALSRKYREELHANEIVLLAYYVAATNIEAVFHDAVGASEYEPFDGMVLTDTFQMTEERDIVDTAMFPRNNARVDRQNQLDIRVIVGNPPYSVGQSSQNDDNQNISYPTLDESIKSTYAAKSTGNPRSLYDSYIRAIRWASNRVREVEDGGIVAMVTNGGWLDGKTADGIRKTLENEFHHVYVLNLRGNQRASGEQSRREGGKIFGQGSRNTVAITMLIKEAGQVPKEGAKIHYHDIGDYLTREEKLKLVESASMSSIEWGSIEPNEQSDWINHRNQDYANLVPLVDSDDSIFIDYHRGIESGRDSWVYNYSKSKLASNIESMSKFFNQQIESYKETGPDQSALKKVRVAEVKSLVVRDDEKFSWTNTAFSQLADQQPMHWIEDRAVLALYRPFCKQWFAFDKQYLQQINGLTEFYPHSGESNIGLTIQQSGPAPFTALAVDRVADLVVHGAGNPAAVMTRWRFINKTKKDLLDSGSEEGLERLTNINPVALKRINDELSATFTDEDLFYYVYGVLQSLEFKEKYGESLKKDAPRVPLVSDKNVFLQFSEAGKALCELHINYEQQPLYDLKEYWADGNDITDRSDFLKIGTKKMAYPKVKDKDTSKNRPDKTQLIYNEHLTIKGIPLEAHDYLIGTRSVIDWIIDRYYEKSDNRSGILNDPNELIVEKEDPRYVLELIKKVVTVATNTQKIISSLPKIS